MKKLFWILFFSNAMNLSSQSLVFSPAQTVSTGTSFGSVKPRITATGMDSIIIMWSKSSPGAVFISKKTGGVFTSPLQVSPSGMDVFSNASDGPNIAAKGNYVFVSFFSLPGSTSRVYIVKSTDGGISFSDTVRVDHQDISLRQSYSPFIEIDDSGNPLVCFETSESTMANPQHMFTRSTNGGNNFSMEVCANLGGPGEPCECCPPSMVQKDSLVFLMYRNNVSNTRNIYVAVSTDYGQSFNNVIQADDTNWIINGCPSSGPEGVISGDSLVITWMSRVASVNRIYYNKMHLQTLLTGGVRKADPAATAGLQRRPVIAGRGDTVVIAWDDNRNGNYDCFLTWSTDGGTTFSSAVQVNDTTVGGTQQTPHLLVMDSTIHITYQDLQNNSVIYRSAVLSSPASLPDLSSSPAVTSYPNPASDKTTIQLDSNPGFISGELISSTGPTVKKMNLKGKHKIELYADDLPPGIYFFKAIDVTGKPAIHKIIFLKK